MDQGRWPWLWDLSGLLGLKRDSDCSISPYFEEVRDRFQPLLNANAPLTDYEKEMDKLAVELLVRSGKRIDTKAD